MSRRHFTPPHKRKNRGTRRELEKPSLTGRLTVTHSGYGFVKPDDGENFPQDVFVPPQYLRQALDGDLVRVAFAPGENGKGPVGEVREVVEPGRKTFVGEVLAGRVVRPLDKSLPDDLPISGSLKGAKRGDWVKLKLLRGDQEGEHAVKIDSTIGPAGSVKGDLDAVCAEYELAAPYSAEEDAAAAATQPRTIAREDFRKRFTVTIDPTDAKDFDDALSIAPGKTRALLEIGVHIADVAAWVTPKSPLDKGAYQRCFTAYLPGRTLPMLPKSLTAMISLHENADCPAHSVIFQIERATGKIVEYRRCHTTVRIAKRLDYETVQQFIDTGDAPADWNATFRSKIKMLTDITRKMRKLRQKEDQFLDLALPEIRVLCDENADKVSGVAAKIQRESEYLVEECMLAANQAVGLELRKIGVAGLYRIHQEPDPDKLDEFIGQMADNFAIYPGDLSQRGNCLKFIASLPEGPRKPLILNMFLRSLPRAAYSEKPDLHYGLGKTFYCHFTSPIRRYPDLTVHQQLWNYDQKQRTRPASGMAALAELVSFREENNDNAYFAASDRLKLRYLAEQMERSGENFYEGIIAKVTNNGFLAEIPEVGIYGFIPRENLPYNTSRRGGKLIDTRNRQSYKVGDFVYLRLSMIDTARGSAEFKPVSRSR